MARGGNKKAKLQQQIAQLDLKRRNGMMRCIAAIVGFAVLIVLKLSLSSSGAAWADTEVANGVFFVMALVAAGIAGIGSRDWKRARDEIAALSQRLHR